MQILCQQWTVTSRYCEALVCICFLFYENMNLSSCLVFILFLHFFFFFSLFSLYPFFFRKRNWGYCMRCMRFPLEKLMCKTCIFTEQARQPELPQKRCGVLPEVGWPPAGFPRRASYLPSSLPPVRRQGAVLTGQRGGLGGLLHSPWAAGVLRTCSVWLGETTERLRRLERTPQKMKKLIGSGSVFIQFQGLQMLILIMLF